MLQNTKNYMSSTKREKPMDGKKDFLFLHKDTKLTSFVHLKRVLSHRSQKLLQELEFIDRDAFLLSKVKPKLAHSILEESRSTMGRLLEARLKSLSKNVIHKFRLDLNYIFNDKLL